MTLIKIQTKIESKSKKIISFGQTPFKLLEDKNPNGSILPNKVIQINIPMEFKLHIHFLLLKKLFLSINQKIFLIKNIYIF